MYKSCFYAVQCIYVLSIFNFRIYSKFKCSYAVLSQYNLKFGVAESLSCIIKSNLSDLFIVLAQC